MTYKWLRQDVVTAVHKMQIAEHGGDDGIRDKGLLESALLRPINKYNYKKSDIAALAAAYAYGLIKNHPFIDGNKRTSLIACLLFLKLNGYKLQIKQTRLYQIFIALATGEMSEDELAIIIKENIVIID